MQNLSGAWFKATVTISVYPDYPPPGWVYQKFHFPSNYTLVNLNDAYDGAQVDVQFRPLTLPLGWSVVQEGAVYKLTYKQNNLLPSITSQPESQTVRAGNSVTLTIGVSPNSTSTSFQWFYNGIALNGATTASYIINRVESLHAGSYHCVVTNQAGAKSSNTAQLTVISERTLSVDTWIYYSSTDRALMAGGQTVLMQDLNRVLSGKLAQNATHTLKYGLNKSAQFIGQVEFKNGFVSEGYLNESGTSVYLFYGTERSARIQGQSRVSFVNGLLSAAYLAADNEQILQTGPSLTAQFERGSKVNFASGYVASGYLNPTLASHKYRTTEAAIQVKTVPAPGQLEKLWVTGSDVSIINRFRIALENLEKLMDTNYVQKSDGSIQVKLTATLNNAQQLSNLIKEIHAGPFKVLEIKNQQGALEAINILTQYFPVIFERVGSNQGLLALAMLNQNTTLLSSAGKVTVNAGTWVRFVQGYYVNKPAKPVFYIHPYSRYTFPLKSTVFKAYADCNTPLTYQWQYRSKKNNPWINLTGETKSEYILVSVGINMNGYMYRSVATCAGGTAISNEAELKVDTKRPTIIKQPTSQSNYIDMPVRFEVKAFSDLRITYQWLYKVPGKTYWDSLRGANDTSLFITVKPELNGYLYKCVASTRENLGSTTYTYPTLSDPVLLTVKSRTAVFTVHPQAKFANPNSPASFTVSERGGFPLPSFQWQYRTGAASPWQDIPNATGTTYNIYAATASMNGYEYRCVASNSVGIVYSNPALLTVGTSIQKEITVVTPYTTIFTGPSISQFPLENYLKSVSTYIYNDGIYKGTLNLVSHSIISEAAGPGVYNFKISRTYKGILPK